MISLFVRQSTPPPHSYSFMLSAVVHCIVIFAVSTAVTYSPPVVITSFRNPELRNFYIDSQLIFNRSSLKASQPNSRKPSDASPSDEKHPSSSPFEAQTSLPQEHADVARVQIQPVMVPRLEVNQEVALVSLMIWSAPDSHNNMIHAPSPSAPVDAEVTPVLLTTPLQKAELAQMALTARDMDSRTPTIVPSTTSPIAVHASTDDHTAPEMASLSDERSASARIMTLSNALSPKGEVAVLQANIDAGPGAQSKNSSASTRLAGGSGSGAGVDNQPSLRKLTLPKDGKFGMVVVGASLEELYPSTASVWKGKIVYTVYLNVGMGSKWVLQYARLSEDAQSELKQSHLEAPWPIDLVIPNMQNVSFAGPLIIHGELRKDGTLAQLSVASPLNFNWSDFVLNALRQWHFRPAQEDGQPAPLEILLIVP